MNYKFWRNSAVVAVAIASLATAGSALAAETGVLAPTQALRRGAVKIDRIKWFDDRIARLQDKKSKFQAILNRDYTTWKTLTEKLDPKSPALKVVTADNFEKFAQMHEALQNGDKTTAEALRKELGLQRVGMGLGQGKVAGLGLGLGKWHGQAREHGSGMCLGQVK